MSAEVRSPGLSTVADAAASFRGWALASAALLSLSYLSVLIHVVDVVVGPAGLGVFALEVLATLAFAAALSRVLSVGYAIGLGVVLFFGGLFAYLAFVPGAYLDAGRQVADTIALLTGLSVLRMVKAGVWALGFAPAPIFVSWYFFLRREYALGALVGGAALSFFILTGDADTLVGLAGAVGAVGALGFGRMEQEGGSVPQRNTLVAVIVAMLLVTTTISLIPGGPSRSLPGSGGSTTTIEGSLIDAGSRVPIVGSISLTPETRFTVTADRRDYWRAGAYNRYTGGGWVRTGQAISYDGSLPRPVGDAQRVRQTFRAESSVAVMPAVWKPVRVDSRNGVSVTSLGGLQPTGSLGAGDRYTVESLRPEASPEELRAAGTDYPDRIEGRYLQLPESTPDRIGQFTGRITANAQNPYETAVAIERWLERNKEYSLDVNRPDGDVAARFLFEMDAGYCTYFATAMVVMLRSQDVPARFVVGYTPGQQVGEDRWVVRGFDSHTWVEVYFPGRGWVRFDPTPAAPRLAGERERLEQARTDGERNVDTNASEGDPYAPPPETETVTLALGGGETPAGDQQVTPPPVPAVELGPTAPSGIGSEDDTLPSRETMLYWAILLAGVATVVQRTGLHSRAYRELWLRLSPSGSPGERIEGAYDRLEYLLARRYRERRTDETPREYLDSLRIRGLDETAFALYRLYERAHYAGDATEEAAETADDLLRDLR